MVFTKQIGVASALGVALLIGCGLIAPPAQAAYVVTLNQVGSNVIATGSGSLDLTGLNFAGGNTAPAQIEAHFGLIFTGSSSPEPVDLYTGITGPASFGSGTPPTPLAAAAETSSASTPSDTTFSCRRVTSPVVPCWTALPMTTKPSAASA